MVMQTMKAKRLLNYVGNATIAVDLLFYVY